MLTKVDWKSLSMPACLPLTINYFPDEKTLLQNYDEYNYTMIMEEEEVYSEVRKSNICHVSSSPLFSLTIVGGDQGVLERGAILEKKAETGSAEGRIGVRA